ncbi:MAG: stage III sporulation protein AE [bacterium]
MKKTKYDILVLLIIVINVFYISSSATGTAFANNEIKNGLNSSENIIFDQLDQLDLENLQKEIDKINRQKKDYLPELKMKEVIKDFLKGNIELGEEKLLKNILKTLAGEVTSNLNILGQIIILSVISSILKVFYNSFQGQRISQTANLLIFLVLSVLVLQSFHLAIDIGVNTVDLMASFMRALLPVLLTLLVSMGAISSAIIFQPITFLLISFLVTIIKSIIFPLIFISCVLFIVDEISSEIKISRLAGVFRELSIGLLGLTLMSFISWLLIKGGAAAVADSLSLRTAKFLTGAIIPVIGGIFTDAVDLIISCSLIIKNALNFFGVIVILVIIIYPLIKLAALIIIYKLAAALLEPISEDKLAGILNKVANNLILILIVVLTVAFMFFIVITILAGTANLSVMMR